MRPPLHFCKKSLILSRGCARILKEVSKSALPVCVCVCVCVCVLANYLEQPNNPR